MKKNIITIANQKGGVAKTTTAFNLGAALAIKGKKVLLIDLDAQGNLSTYNAWDGNGVTIADLLDRVIRRDTVNAIYAIQKNEKENLDYIPADAGLANITDKVGAAMASETVFKRLLSDETFVTYDFIIIDCLPALNILTVNALAASTGVIVPVQAQDFALDGLAQFEETFGQVKEYINPEISLIGILSTMVEKRTTTAKTALTSLNEKYGTDMFTTEIEKRAEAPDSVRFRRSLVNTKGSKLGAKYIELADELLKRIGD